MKNRKRMILMALGLAAVVILAVSIFGLAEKEELPYGLSLLNLETRFEILPTSNKSNITSGQEFFAGADYVGSETCRSCHSEQFAGSEKTTHRRQERPLTPEEVIADFNDVTFTMKDIKVPTDDKKSEIKTDLTMKFFHEGDKYFFTLVDPLNSNNNQTYQLSYILGGVWEQMYEVKLGDYRYPSPMRWVKEDQAWRSKGFRPYDWYKVVDGRAVPRKPDELKKGRAAEAKCAGCHNTGYTPTVDVTSGKVTGTEVEIGIGCEACHGPGSAHVAGGGDPSKIVKPLKDLNALQQNQLCGQCHSRLTSKDNEVFSFPVKFLPGDTNLQDKVAFWSYSFGGDKPEKSWWPNDFAKANRQQYQDNLHGTHAETNVSCLTCHASHGDKIKGIGMLRVAEKDICAGCHNQQGQSRKPNVEMYQGSVMEKAGVTCVDCHMARIGNRAAKTKVKDKHWDVSSHTFVAASPELKAKWGIRSACEQCHGEKGQASLKLDKESELRLYTENKQKVKSTIENLEKDLALVTKAVIEIKDAEEAQELIGDARNNVALVIQDGSFGFHSPGKTEKLLKEAQAKIAQAKKELGL